MNEPFTPTTEVVALNYDNGRRWAGHLNGDREFQRWIAAYEQSIRADERRKTQTGIAGAVGSGGRFPAVEWLCAEDAYWRAMNDAARIAESWQPSEGAGT